MKWITFQSSNRSTVACARQPLAELLTDQLDAQSTARVTEHLDRCEECQRRLTKLSAEPNWWREAGQWLENASIEDEFSDERGGEEYSGEEFGEHQGPSPDESLIQSGLMQASARSGIIGSIGRYDIRRVIGTGGTGIVLQAVDTELDRVVAVKVLAPAFAGNGPARRRFSREGQAAAAVVHENVVAIHHVESNGPVPFLVMQFVDGCSLHEQIMRQGPMDPTSTLRIIAQLASALDAAHAQGLVHRDVKPANILVGANGQRVWITDFGLARAVDDASLTRTGFIAGTPHYMSPEQARGESVGPGSDLFGLGSVMYFVLSGRPPFRAERSLAILNRICSEKHRPVREVNPDVPSSVAAIVDRLLEKDAGQRFQAANEVRDECLRLLAHPDSIPESRQPILFVKKPRRIMLNLIVGLLALAGIAYPGIVLSGWNWQNIPSDVRTPTPAAKQSNASRVLQAQQQRKNGPSTNENRLANVAPNQNNHPLTVPLPELPSERMHLLPGFSDMSAQTVTQHVPSEYQLWQLEFDGLDRDIQLQAISNLQSESSPVGSSTDSVQQSFDQQLSQLNALFNQLEAPVAAPTRSYPLEPHSISNTRTTHEM